MKKTPGHPAGGKDVDAVMLFREEIEPRCAYCRHGEPLSEESVLCPKKGVVDAGGHCRSFVYDPFRRTPPVQAAPDFSHLKDEDFSLEIGEDAPPEDGEPEHAAPEDTAAENAASEGD